MEAITLKQLRYFDALAKTRHFSRAADLCAISQPALSMQIKDLEARLPLPLIETASKPLQIVVRSIFAPAQFALLVVATP